MRRESLSLLKKRLGRYKYREELAGFLERIFELEPVAVILFGSLGRGDYLEDSDADVAVILNEERVNTLKKIEELKEFDESGLIDVFPYGYEQFKGMIEDVNPFVFDILEGAVVFTGDERKLKDILETMERVITERGVKRTEYGLEYAA
ncbi:MAG TPA: nucleotidyltransferase domain-containing protein [Candidatus Syntrophoarchaeum butanivorans]|uniref:Nucleotidyltransferase domain-containing protein n=1 Tax=Candidatus Syntropharchaeum butanivorans TaxID=1839936 RepID=A0A7C0X3Y6_9EURY|nr:nucleotidyltransferase domain-containing protein [Candidatus Syntrophoarchaeum butanivorans]